MFAVIYIPDFALQAALRLEAALGDSPVALIDRCVPKSSVVQLTDDARDQGVTEGLTPTQARARCPHLIIKSRSAAMERSAGGALLQCAYDFSPAIEATAEGVVTLDLKGFKGLCLQDYGQRMIQHLRLVHLKAQVGVAAKPLLALYAARRARPVLVVSDEMTESESRGKRWSSAAAFLEDLAIEAIEPSPETLRVLKQWGIQTLGAFVALGEGALTERLGAEGRCLFDRATVRSTRPLRLVRPEEHFEEAVDFEREIETTEPLLLVLRRFVEQITVRMGMAGKVVESLVLRLKFSVGPDYQHVFNVPEPTRNDQMLYRMLHTFLEYFKSENTIVGVRLFGKPCFGKGRQFGLFGASLRDPNRFGETLAQLSTLVGADRVGRPAVKSTHYPDAFEMRPVDYFARNPASQAVGSVPAGREFAGSSSKTGLPLRRFRPPLAAEVELAEGRQSRFRAVDCAGAIEQARGPWRGSGDWWDDQRWARDEWDVETVEGDLFRLFQENNRWFVDGIYD